VFLLSALDTREDRIAGAEAGCDGYLGKPVDPGELIARVKFELRQRERIQQALRAAAAGAPPA
jgi:DNA-binding response OmpR family regulator